MREQKSMVRVGYAMGVAWDGWQDESFFRSRTRALRDGRYEGRGCLVAVSGRESSPGVGEDAETGCRQGD